MFFEAQWRELKLNSLLENLFSSHLGKMSRVSGSLLHRAMVLGVIGGAITGKSGLLQRLANSPTLCAQRSSPRMFPPNFRERDYIFLGHTVDSNCF